MAIVNIDLDTPRPDGKPGDDARAAFSKVNSNFADVQSQITAEVSARQSAISSVQTTVATKASSSDLASEISARQSADSAISATVTAQGQAINQRALSADLTAEVAARQAADVALQTTLQAADTALGSRIDGVLSMTGRNKLLNPGFTRTSRGPGGTFSNFTTEFYTVDQWVLSGISMSGSWGRNQLNGASNTLAEGRNYFVVNITSANLASVGQKIEGVHTLAGSKATLSVWLRSTVAGKRLGFRIYQSFGTGGSPSAAVSTIITPTPLTLSTTWQKYTLTFDVPSVSGKTIGTNNNDHLYVVFDITNTDSYGGSLSGQTGQIEFAFPQLEKGSVATEFEFRAPGVEKALCEWYLKAGVVALRGNGTGSAGAGTFISHEMRAAPAITFANTIYYYNCSGINYASYPTGVEVLVNATGTFAFYSTYIMSAEL
ncbi:deduced tail fiber protein [Xanthomonas phage OP1]|uniref:Deduced tail fiber protein n=2 Tax=Xipdecavirus OP1 TaxID=329254 RepID=Q2NPG6_9CAUD|nr:tail fiber protein [Xanthomonas phage OP1]BAE72673.1 deduced tail fiber protein [Xanthomonas phage OP1]BAE72730.1 deduced tail fiber protein [Xanthomonas phage OP1]